MVKQSGPDHKTSVKAKREMKYGQFGNLTEFLDEVMINRHHWHEATNTPVGEEWP